MKKFLRDILLFTIPILALLLIWIGYYLKTGSVAENRMEEISGYEILLMGDSQIQRFNPQFFSAATYNFASSAEHYYFTWQKLRKITSFPDCKVKKVILGLSANSFSPVFTRLYDINSPEGVNSLENYFYFIEGEDFTGIEDYFTLRTARAIILGRPYWGGLVVSELSNPDTLVINETLRMHFGGTDTVPCGSQAEYLSKIVRLCKGAGIELVFVTPPAHRYYLSKVGNQYTNMLHRTLQEHREIEHIDLSVPETDPSLLSDAVHLNRAGAKKYSLLLAEHDRGEPRFEVRWSRR